ncbi:sulfide/dihydroorotate dehydrogenase-like FAD/NAD-binding protein [Candidatus Fermentibacteria bacterium]|nr:sulfide/dihydroorotate dehydrogenase-like FAD/NAD-binding protein [Candidatus Fermentibacteria bacterium]
MNRLLAKDRLGPDVYRYVVEAPEIAVRRKPGQFVIVRICETGERVPLTIADADPRKGTVTLIVQSVGKSTRQMSLMEPGDALCGVAGPLGRPTHIERFGTVISCGGGIGAAPLHPITQALHEAGNRVITLLCARTADLLIMVDEMEALSDELVIMTDDGSRGVKGLSTDGIRMIVDRGGKVDHVFAIGPPVMMKFVSRLTGELGIPTTVSLNPIMIDGTGMCGCCRVTVGGETKFACVDGPEFDGHAVDFDELMTRLGAYRDSEKKALEHWEGECRLGEVM